MGISAKPSLSDSILEEAERLIESDPEQAAAKAQGVLRSNRRSAEAYRVLGAALRRLGRDGPAKDAELAAIEVSQFDPEIARAGAALSRGDLPTAEGILRAILARRPNDVAALRMLGEIAARVGQLRDAEALFNRALTLAPGFNYARLGLALVLQMLSRSGEAVEQMERITGPEADYDPYVSLTAGALSRVGEHERAIKLYRKLLERQPANHDIAISLANLYKIVGDQEQSIATYRRVLDTSPSNGEAWWSLANLKTVDFSDSDVAAMEAAVGADDLSDDDRLRLHFALGKAREDRGEYGGAFAHYAQANAIRGGQVQFDSESIAAFVEASETLFTADFLQSRKTAGYAGEAPIFIVGMPRSGSTLVEQILASHPLVEGTGELPDIIVLARSLEETAPGGVREGWARYPSLLTDLQPEELRELGATYVERTRIQRKTDRPQFIDKMPNNWMHVGLISLILPNAKIVDARRHPLACGFSNFKQHFARGQEFSYDLEVLGRYYREYVRMMAHFDTVAPGLIHRVTHERLLADPEPEIRRLLDFLGLPFDEACLRFHETDRPVRTASSEQVRRPLSADASQQWRNFDEWLGPLKDGLGSTLDDWDQR